MEMRHLRYFVAVAEELHFGHAAVRLHMAQPPLSLQIRQLEEELGVPLLRRTKRKVELTDGGAAFLPEARRILVAVEGAKEAARRAHRGESGRLVIGFVTSAAAEVLPTVLRAHRERYPAVEMTLRELTVGEALQALERGTIGVGLLRPPVGSAALAYEVIRREPFVVALPERHPLAAHGTLALAALAGQPFILFPRHWGSGLYDQVISHCMAAGFSPDVVQEATEMTTIVGIVAAGIGISLVPAPVALLRTAGVAYRPLIAPGLLGELAMAWRRDETSGVVAAFLATARAALTPEGGDSSNKPDLESIRVASK